MPFLNVLNLDWLNKIPGASAVPEEALQVMFIGVATQMVLGAVRAMMTGNMDKQKNPDHWFHTRVMSRFGPVLNMVTGGLIGAVVSVPMVWAVIGGGFSSQTRSLVTKTLVPLVQNRLFTPDKS